MSLLSSGSSSLLAHNFPPPSQQKRCPCHSLFLQLFAVFPPAACHNHLSILIFRGRSKCIAFSPHPHFLPFDPLIEFLSSDLSMAPSALDKTVLGQISHFLPTQLPSIGAGTPPEGPRMRDLGSVLSFCPKMDLPPIQ